MAPVGDEFLVRHATSCLRIHHQSLVQVEQHNKVWAVRTLLSAAAGSSVGRWYTSCTLQDHAPP